MHNLGLSLVVAAGFLLLAKISAKKKKPPKKPKIHRVLVQ
jgi:hypothetical protein